MSSSDVSEIFFLPTSQTGKNLCHLGNLLFTDTETQLELCNLILNPYNYTSNYNFQNTPEGFDESYKTFCGT